jgi:hypothetical protein
MYVLKARFCQKRFCLHSLNGGIMPVVDVRNTKGKKVTTVDLAEDIFNVSVKPSVLHEIVTMQLANRRAATAAVKHRSDVKGSRRKLFLGLMVANMPSRRLRKSANWH